MIQASLEVNNKPLDLLIDYLDNYNQIVDTEFNAAYDVVEPLLLEDLQQEPGAVKYPIEWTSEKQRKAFFASSGFENGIPYQRSGGLAKAWVVKKEGGGVAILVKVSNPNPASKFVYGSLSLSNRGAGQQRFHANTGWEQAGNIVDYWLSALIQQFFSNISSSLDDMVGSIKTQRRAYTTPYHAKK